MDAEDPSSSEGDEEDRDDPTSTKESRALEQSFLLKGLQAAQLADLVEATKSTANQRAALSRLELDIDKTLLQLLAIECREGEERGMRALEVVSLLRDRSGKMMEAAGRIAERYGRTLLGEKIREVAERGLRGDVEEEEEEDEEF
jgi:chromosome transmission fidelity protein 4